MDCFVTPLREAPRNDGTGTFCEIIKNDRFKRSFVSIPLLNGPFPLFPGNGLDFPPLFQ